MAIHKKSKLIFVHIPKTGGTSISFGIDGWQTNDKDRKICVHSTIRYYQHYLDLGYKSFTVVRHPYDRFISSYNFALSTNNFWHNEKNKHINYHTCKNNTLTDFLYILKNSINSETGFFNKGSNLFHSSWLTQSFYVTLNNQINVDFVLKFENLSNDYEIIAKHFNLPIKLPHLNQCLDVKNNIKLNKEQKQILYDIYHKDFSTFGYEP